MGRSCPTDPPLPHAPITLDDNGAPHPVRTPGSRGSAGVFRSGRSTSIRVITVGRRSRHVDPDHRLVIQHCRSTCHLTVVSPYRAACPETPSGWNISSAWYWTRRSECRSWRDDGGCGGRQWGWRTPSKFLWLWCGRPSDETAEESSPVIDMVASALSKTGRSRAICASQNPTQVTTTDDVR